MTVLRTPLNAGGFRFSIERDGKEVARARLYILRNDIHPEPFGYVEDVHVDEGYRGQGISSELLSDLETAATELGLYKIILHTESVNFIAQSLYTKRGWYVVGPTLRFDFNMVT